MSWSDLHAQSEQLAEAAHKALRSGDLESAARLFAEAAHAETGALNEIGDDKPRTFGITAVSAVALLYKAGELQAAERLAHEAAARPSLPVFAAEELRSLLQTIWNEAAQKEAGVSFAPGQVLVSVKGGEVVRGGAPLDLIVEKAQAVQSMFYRAVEYVQNLPLRKKGPPSRKLQERCRPWLFQSVPGSYQFSVAIQKAKQPDLFEEPFPDPEILTRKFMAILRAATESPDEALKEIVTKDDYRETFLKMTRNLSPSGKVFSQMDIQEAGERRPVTLSPESRKLISETLRGPSKEQTDGQAKEETILHGVLRALNLDKDWLEITTADGQHRKVDGVGEAVDDVIGPMVNHNVMVRARSGKGGSLKFIDIEADE